MTTQVGERALRPLRHLEHLDLSGNRLTRLPSRLLADLPTLQRLTLSRNPLHCDCQLAPLVRAATQRRPHFKLQVESSFRWLSFVDTLVSSVFCWFVFVGRLLEPAGAQGPTAEPTQRRRSGLSDFIRHVR